MPFARAPDDTRVYYETAGAAALDAPTVLLVMGLALRGEVWGETRDALAGAGYRTITMDNRGAGETRAASWPYTTAAMAGDALAVLGAAFARRAHVVGVSLGGLVAQELVLAHPDRVGALVLQSTTAGALRFDVLAPLSGLRFAAVLRERLRGAPPDRQARVALRLLTTTRFARRADLTNPRVRLLLDGLEDRAGPSGYAGQVLAASRHHAWRRLREIRAPTLIQHGAKDRIVRAAAARAMARRIPDATLEVYEHAGHALALQRPDSLAALARFLSAHDDRLVPAGR